MTFKACFIAAAVTATAFRIFFDKEEEEERSTFPTNFSFQNSRTLAETLFRMSFIELKMFEICYHYFIVYLYVCDARAYALHQTVSM